MVAGVARVRAEEKKKEKKKEAASLVAVSHKMCTRLFFFFFLFFHVRRFVIFRGWCATGIMALSTRASVSGESGRIGRRGEERLSTILAWRED
jgi:flagellar biogenesis protein FliO